jgi:hypothetical protein
MFKKVNRWLIFVLILVFFFWAVTSYWVAIAMDEGLPGSFIGKAFAYSSIAFHFPIGLFWNEGISLTAFIVVIVLNCAVYAFLVERLVWFGRRSIGKSRIRY